MRITWLISGLIGSLLGAGYAQAQVGLSGDLGTTGVGAHFSVPVQPNMNARFGLNYLNYSESGYDSQVHYNATLTLQTFDALLDYFPMDGRFRVSGGLVYNGNRADLTAKPDSTGTLKFNGRRYVAATAGTVTGNVEFRKMAPYLGIGWGNAVKDSGWRFSTDLGVLYQGSPTTSLRNRGCTESADFCAQLRSDVADERKSLSDKANNFRFYPVLRLSVSHSF